MSKNIHPLCDVCGSELSAKEKEKNIDYENTEYPICDKCFEKTIEKIKYVLNSDTVA